MISLFRFYGCSSHKRIHSNGEPKTSGNISESFFENIVLEPDPKFLEAISNFEGMSLDDLIITSIYKIRHKSTKTSILADELDSNGKLRKYLPIYFMLNWSKRLGAGPAWFITLMRDRCYINMRTGEKRDVLNFENEY